MRTAIFLLAAMLASQVAVPPEMEPQQFWVPRHRPAQTSDDSETKEQFIEIERHDGRVTITTYQPVSSAPTEYHMLEETITIDACGWRELIPSLEAACQE